MIAGNQNEERLRRAADGAAEFELIGSLLLDESQIDEVGRLIRPEYFASESLRDVYTVLLELQRDNRPTTPETIAAELGGSCVVDDLLRAMELTPNGVHADYHARRVLDDFKRRSFGESMTEATRDLKRVAQNPDEVLAAHVSRVESLLDGATDESDGHIADLLVAAQDSPEVERFTTGIWDLDVLLDGGCGAGQLVCIGARPSVGKTAFCSGLALASALDGVPTLFLNFEMTQHEMTQRLRKQSGVKSWDEVDALNRLAGLSLFIRDASGWSVDRVECEVRRYSRRQGVKIVLVDYLSLVRPRDPRLPRYEQVADISRSLKLLALKTDVAVVAAQQLSREIEKRPDRRPQMSDFRESGSIEQDADVLIGLDRPVRPDDGDRTEARLFLMKNRHGETGNLKLTFDPARTLFTESKS